jgi:hypothetical protein
MEYDIPDIERILRRQPTWQPPPGFGQRLVPFVPTYEPIQRFQLRLPRIPAGAVAGVGAALLGTIGEGGVNLASAPAFVAAALIVSVGGWLLANA